MFLKISQIPLENTCVGVSFNKYAVLRAWKFIKKDFDSAVLKKNSFEEHM